MQRLAGVMVCLLFVVPTCGWAQQSGTSGGVAAADVEALVSPIRSVASEQLSSVLRDVYQDTAIRITAEPVNNLLLIRAPRSHRDQVLQLLDQLDRSPRTMLIQLLCSSLANPS